MMTENQIEPMESALKTRLRTARGNVAEAEAWLLTIPANHPDHAEALEEWEFWGEQVQEIEVALADREAREKAKDA